MESLNLEPDARSVLTNISVNESPVSTPRSICLHANDRFIGFQKNDDPNIAKYMATERENIGWSKYKHQCWQFGIPPIRMIKDCLNGGSDLDLSYYIPKSIGAVYAFEVLSEQPEISVIRIDMEDCPMTETGCLSLNEFLRRRTPIECLNLKNNKIGHKGLEILDEGLYANHCIKYINLSGCKIGDEGAIILARSLNCNELCEHLDISHNNLYTNCGDAISDILTKTRIKVLNLEWNELYMDTCVQKIFQGLKKSEHIKEMNYSWNGLSGTEWVKSLKQALLKNATLEILRMENNRMAGIADQIMPAASKSSSLRELYLGENPWKEQDWKNILSAYQRPSNLNILGLGAHTYLSEECVKMIGKVTRMNPELKIIYKGQIKEQPVEEANFKNILIDRIKALAMKPKKKKLRKNMGHFFLKLKEENIEYDDPDNFSKTLAAFGAKLDAPLIQQFTDEFSFDSVVKNKKSTKVALLEISDYYLSRHPTEPPPIKKAKKQRKKKKTGDKEKGLKNNKKN